MDSESAANPEQHRGFLDQLAGGCFGKIIGLSIFAGFALLGAPIADALGVPEQKNAKDGLLVYGVIGAGAGVLVIVPAWHLLRTVARKKRSQTAEKESHRNDPV